MASLAYLRNDNIKVIGWLVSWERVECSGILLCEVNGSRYMKEPTFMAKYLEGFCTYICNLHILTSTEYFSSTPCS